MEDICISCEFETHNTVSTLSSKVDDADVIPMSPELMTKFIDDKKHEGLPVVSNLFE